jgi:transposase
MREDKEGAMAGSAAKVLISERQHKVLRKLSTATTLAQRRVQRSPIILLAFSGQANQDIAQQVGLGRCQVGLGRRRWQDAFSMLIRSECLAEPPALRQAIEDLLGDEPRRGCPGKFTAEQLTQRIALACEPPEKSGRPLTPWTGQELAEEAVVRGIVDCIAPSQVKRYLREAELPPHKSRYWLNTTAKDPEAFQAQVEMVCACYHEAPQLYQRHDTHTICVDERTGIQALERIAPTLPMKPGPMERREFEYQRHGTVTWIGTFPVVTGERIAPTLGPRRTAEDFVTHSDRVIDLDPEAWYVFVLDNLNIHCSAGLVELVAWRCGAEEELGKKGTRGRCTR